MEGGPPQAIDEPRSRIRSAMYGSRHGYCCIATLWSSNVGNGSWEGCAEYQFLCSSRRAPSPQRDSRPFWQPAPPLRENRRPRPCQARARRGRRFGPFASLCSIHARRSCSVGPEGKSGVLILRGKPPCMTERRHARGIGCAEKRAHRTSLRHAKKRRPLRSHRIHPLARRPCAPRGWACPDPIGKASAALSIE